MVFTHQRPQAEQARTPLAGALKPVSPPDRVRGPWRLWQPLGIAACLTMMLTGCLLPQSRPDPTQFYLIQPHVTTSGPASTEISKREAIRIGLMKIDVPDYLRRPPIAVQIDREGHRIQYAELHRWAEPLEANLQRALRLSLASHSAVRSVELEPFRSPSKLDCIVSVEILACQGMRPTNGHPGIRFKAHWRAMSPSGTSPEAASSETFTARSQDWDGNNFASLANRLSQATAALASQIVTKLTSEQPPSLAPGNGR